MPTAKKTAAKKPRKPAAKKTPDPPKNVTVDGQPVVTYDGHGAVVTINDQPFELTDQQALTLRQDLNAACAGFVH